MGPSKNCESRSGSRVRQTKRRLRKETLGGIKELRGWPSNLTDESKRKERMERLWVFYQNNEARLIKAVEKFDLTERHCAYPPMKMMDMYLWGKEQFLLKQEKDRAIKS